MGEEKLIIFEPFCQKPDPWITKEQNTSLFKISSTPFLWRIVMSTFFTKLNDILMICLKREAMRHVCYHYKRLLIILLLISCVVPAFSLLTVVRCRAANVILYGNTVVPAVSFSDHMRTYTFHGKVYVNHRNGTPYSYSIKGTYDIDKQIATESVEINMNGGNYLRLSSRVKSSADPWLFIGAKRKLVSYPSGNELLSGAFYVMPGYDWFLIKDNLPLSRRLITGAAKNDLLDKAVIQSKYLEILEPRAFEQLPDNGKDKVKVVLQQHAMRDLLEQGVIQYSRSAMVVISNGPNRGGSKNDQNRVVDVFIVKAGSVPGLVATFNQVVEDIVGVEGRNAPTQHVEIRFPVFDFREMDGFRNG